MLFRNQFDDTHPLLCRIPNYNIGTDISVVEVGYNRVPAGMCQIFKRDVFILHYIAKGKGVFCEAPFDKTNGYLVVPGELEVIKADAENPYESYWIMFKGPRAVEILNSCGLKHNSVFSVTGSQECINIIKEAIHRDDYLNEAEEAYTLQSVFYKIIALHMKEAQKNAALPNSIASSVANYIEKSYHNQLKINDMAKTFHISRNYLYTVFKQEYNMSPQEYLISCRIEKAKKLLKSKSTPLSITEIATATGFENPLYFSRLFHKRVGISPSEYKKKA